MQTSDHIARPTAVAGRPGQPLVRRRAAVVVLQAVAVDVGEEAKLVFLADRARSAGLLAEVPGGPEQLGVGVTDLEPGQQAGPELPEEGPLGQGVVGRSRGRRESGPTGTDRLQSPVAICLARFTAAHFTRWDFHLGSRVRRPPVCPLDDCSGLPAVIERAPGRKTSATSTRTWTRADDEPGSQAHDRRAAPFRAAYSWANVEGPAPVGMALLGRRKDPASARRAGPAVRPAAPWSHSPRA